ncbi:type II secretion system F family protein [candidate division FCPU426 bacterium]|nr:type II secretion system F family protein [candidate division FCPU426 bacterium]
MFFWLIPGITGIAVFLLALSLQTWSKNLRLRKEALHVVAAADVAHAPRPGFMVLMLSRLLPWLAGWQAAWMPETWKTRTEQRLARLAVWPWRFAAEWLVLKELSALAGWGGAFFLNAGFFPSLLLGAAAFFLPDLWLKEKETARKKDVMRELPDFLDLLASCLEAGLGFEQALAVILARDQKSPLHREFSEAARSMRMGVSRQDALQAMGARVADPDFKTFITMVIQAERLGVSVAKTLKAQASQLRGKRFQSVEKQALEAPVKLLIPLIVFIFPVVFIVLFGPIIIRFMKGF